MPQLIVTRPNGELHHSERVIRIHPDKETACQYGKEIFGRGFKVKNYRTWIKTLMGRREMKKLAILQRLQRWREK